MIIQNYGEITVGDNFIVESFSYAPVVLSVSGGAKLIIGNNVFMNQAVHISCSVGVTIGDNCLFAREVFMIDNNWHSVGTQAIKKAPISIESKVWIASRVTILPGVTLGEGCVVGAGAVVTSSIPAYTVAAGVPAKVIRSV
jgi:acetyltransferase-like isoleucine patch superfamily enzyme